MKLDFVSIHNILFDISLYPAAIRSRHDLIFTNGQLEVEISDNLELAITR